MDNTHTTHTYALAVIGPHDVVSVFKAFGIDCFEATTQSETVERIEELKNSSDPAYAVIFVSEDLLEGLDPKTYDRLSHGALPTITAIPLLESSSAASKDKIRRLAERALGSDILK